MEPELHIGLTPELAAPLVLLCLAVSAFFAASETAVIGASRPRMHRLAQQGNARARQLQTLFDDQESVISALLLGNNMVNILAASLSTAVLTDLFGQAGVFYATIAVTFMVVLFAEVLPKTYALLNADRIALVLAPAIRLSVLVLRPISGMLASIVKVMMRVMRLPVDRPSDTAAAADETLRGAIEMHGASVADAPEEKHMLRSILDLGDRTVVSVMTHRADMNLIDIDLPVPEILDQVLASPHTRIPLYRAQPDNIVGVLHAKALLRAVHADPGNPQNLKIGEIANPPWFIPEATLLSDQLAAFRHRKEHFALVVDEYGVLKGVVTLEDIIEEIVGDITDEHDEAVSGVVRQPDGSFVCDGHVPVRDLNRQLGWNLPEDGATTIAGLVIYESRRVPEVGQNFRYHGYRFEILARQDNRITSVRVMPPPPAPAAPAP